MIDNFLYEKYALDRGYSIICGIDEAGRGPLAGPVVAAAVILKYGSIIDGLDDSKKLSAIKREFLYNSIIKSSVAYSVGVADELEINDLNILNATFLAMKRAVESLSIAPDFLYIDGHISRGFDSYSHGCVVSGDKKVSSIAAASIIAKVYRDRYMEDLAKRFPQYYFEKHKGYPTKLHYSMIKEHGVCSAHRLSFLKGIL